MRPDTAKLADLAWGKSLPRYRIDSSDRHPRQGKP